MENFYSNHLILRVEVQNDARINLLRFHNGRLIYPEVQGVVFPINF